MRNRPGPAVDRRIRAAELAAYQGAGLAPRQRVLRLDEGRHRVDVRAVEFGDPKRAEVPVLMLHEIAVPAVLFAPLVRYLGARHVVLLDWPGHGLSGQLVLGPDDSPRRHAAGVLGSLVDALGIEAVDVVAHSMGAQFALYGALDVPHRIRRLVTLGAPGTAFVGVEPSTVMKVLAVPGLGRLLLSVPIGDRGLSWSRTMSLGPGVVGTLPAPVYDAARLVGARRVDAASIAGFFRSFLHRGRVRPGVAIPPEELADVAQPVLMVWGDRDALLRPEAGTSSRAALPDGRTIRLDAGHAPWLEHERAVGKAMADFLTPG